MKSCRLCLKQTAEVYIFNEDQSLQNRILSCCKLKMHKNDGLPQNVCLNCINKLEDAISFISQCKENDKILHLHLNNKINKEDNKTPLGNNIKIGSLQIKQEEPILFKEENLELSMIEGGDFTFKSSENDESDNLYYSDQDYVTLDSLLKSKQNKNVDKLSFETNGKDKCQNVSDSGNNFTPSNSLKSKQTKCKDFDKRGELCPICGKHFKKKSSFDQHMQTHGEKKFFCDKCPKSFHLNDKLKAHKITHSSLKKYGCEYCNKTFKTKRHAKLHMEYVHRKSKSVSCNICGKVFHRPHYLKTHLITHSSERKYACEICNKTYYLRHLLTSHMRVHTGERPYACKFCNSSFTMLQSLKEHERLHTGEKPYKCPTCQKGFAQKGNMKSHFKYNHKDLDFKTTMLAFRQSQLV